MKIILVFLLVFTTVFLGCTNYALSVRDNLACTTIIKGFLHSYSEYNSKAPFIIIKEPTQAYRIYYGSIVELKNDGVVFDPSAEGVGYDYEPRFYNFKREVICLVDSIPQILYGTLPDEYNKVWNVNLTINSTTHPGDGDIVIPLEANKPFSFCCAGGTYYISKIEFDDGQGSVDISRTVPEMIFTVKENTENYLGDITSESADSTTNSIVIPCSIYSRPSDATAGAVGGAIMGAANAIILASRTTVHHFGITGNHPSNDTLRPILTIKKK